MGMTRQQLAAAEVTRRLADIMADGRVLFLTDGNELELLVKAMRSSGITYKQMPLIEGEN